MDETLNTAIPALPLYSLGQIRAIESAALAVLPPAALMQRAGKAAAALALRLKDKSSDPVLVLAGPGNNGGDALEAALGLVAAGVTVQALLLADPGRQPADARLALQRAQAAGLRLEGEAALAALADGRYSLVIDGLFGIGLARPLAGSARQAAQALRDMRCPVLALDVPSGLDADTGAIVGPDGCAVRATHTLTFIGAKPGLFTAYGRDLAGQVEVAGLEIEEPFFPPAAARLNAPALFASALRPRPHASHKGSFGDVAVLGGAPGMVGAPILAARAALHCGAGRVFAGFLDQPLPYDSAQPELMCRRAADIAMDEGSTLVAGPGLGAAPAAHGLLAASLASPCRLVLDADGLNLTAQEAGLARQLEQRAAPTVMTPHPLEAARLLGSSGAQVQADRPAAARALARRFGAVVVLKGSGTVIARPDGQIVINPTGNPALATAGSGDVLSGICGALLAQGWPSWEAALGAVWMHGAAADALVAQGTGPVGLCAGELIPAVRTLLNRLIALQAKG